MRNFISFQDSIKIIKDIVLENLPTQKLFISDALDQILAQDIIADHNSPEYPTSAMDGYAIIFKDQELKELKIIDKNPAGSVVKSIVTKGTCIKTFTGSLMPKGSDTLIPIENVTVHDDMITINKAVKKGFSRREIGENYRENEVLIKKGTKIGFAQIGVLASLNISQVSVYINPTVAIASTGSEILDLGEAQINEAQIRSSNHLTIEALAKKNGANTIQMGVVKDDMESITKLINDALKKADIVVTTGGVSMGDYDFVQDVVKKELKAKVLFHGVRMKPGMHVLVARKEEKFIIALPGFAYSSTVCAILYLLEIIYKYRNANEELPFVKAKILEDLPFNGNKTLFTACNVNYKKGEYQIDFKGKKQGTSAILTNLLETPALLVQDENSSDLKAGDCVDILLLKNL
ncbi:MAG: molybdopterin molybdotransferase MoeA [Candidatus Marinarcus sp.]|uniref:molybdopterin molybdotransferase MoeA n=1 Tax=Candidatus Marinarcus sp. TaxID=3100987 RepID=UPI003B00BEB3